ncbi:MAG: hypothetical protein KME26_20080 [Oscillatoria princeps RMCB-10]|nr:hypothetical protein [Oscillatoria princeps RMCB-10]
MKSRLPSDKDGSGDDIREGRAVPPANPILERRARPAHKDGPVVLALLRRCGAPQNCYLLGDRAWGIIAWGIIASALNLLHAPCAMRYAPCAMSFFVFWDCPPDFA